MQNMHTLHAFVLVVVCNFVKMRLLEKENIWEHVFYKAPGFSSFIFGLFWLQKQQFFKIVVPKTFAIFTLKHLCWCLFLIKLFKKLFNHFIKSMGAFLWIFRNAWNCFFIEHHWWPPLWLLSEELQDRIQKFNNAYACM